MKNTTPSTPSWLLALFGGGHGLENCATNTRKPLERLHKKLRKPSTELAAVQTVFDSGGHSGELRDQYRILPQGDERRAMLSLSNKKYDPGVQTLLTFRGFPGNMSGMSLRDLIQFALIKTHGPQRGKRYAQRIFDKSGFDSAYRATLETVLDFKDWSKNSNFEQAALGNLFLAVWKIIHGPILGKRFACKFLDVRDRILPVTLNKADLCAKLSDGSEICGEALIDTRSPWDERTIESVYLKPRITPQDSLLDTMMNSNVKLFPGTHDAILEARTAVFCQGDLYTSDIPITLVPGFNGAISSTRACIIYVVNIMTKGAETPGFTASKFAETLLSYAGIDRFDAIICNNGPVSKTALRRYAKENAEPVVPDVRALTKYGKRIIATDLVEEKDGSVFHSPKLGEIIANLHYGVC